MQREDDVDNEYGDDYDVPLHHKRPFGAGIQRKPIQFVKATDPTLHTTSPEKTTKSGSSIGDFYLNLVLPGEKGSTEALILEARVCAVCDLPLEKEAVEELSKGDSGRKDATARQKHEASIAHQVCLTHSHPPSALDRSRMGLTYLTSHGWDPDSRKGLGSTGQGMQYPLKTKPKENNFGLGLEVPKELKGRVEKKKPQKLDAKQCRKKAEDDKKKAERLRQMFYGSEDMDRYLGTG
ncbi:g-patch domain-containing protein [Colletotrichum truncatum]|uniref:G-patch domain-containing protein n=1 Tax=Colletotrichum truncatum TaxID=5467 RepID=A0ACC3ZKK0_COLTU|nr:g-patch domain-containing protein [Colletotrichum truncatum]KAF6800010.1 g-patch domain-containing protein [Colletotrichum truncatum]